MHRHAGHLPQDINVQGLDKEEAGNPAGAGRGEGEDSGAVERHVGGGPNMDGRQWVLEQHDGHLQQGDREACAYLSASQWCEWFQGAHHRGALQTGQGQVGPGVAGGV